MGGPCTAWVDLQDVKALPAATADVSLTDELLQTGIDLASELLYRMTGRQFAGVCPDVVRPLRRMYALDDGRGPGWIPAAGWGWRDGVSAHTCGRPPSRNCGCGPLPEITLGAYPIREIIEVRIDGAVLDPAAYRVDDRRWLVRIDGNSWPCCQDLSADPLTDLNTFQVVDTWGQAAPQTGVTAASVLGIELAKSLSGNPCALPQRLQNIVANGQTFALLDPMTFLAQGLTGIYLVDLFIQTFNPNKLQRRSSVYSPDIPRPVRRTAVAPGS